MPGESPEFDKELVFIGAAHVDECLRLQDALQPGESNRVSRQYQSGGVAANAARAATQHARCHLISLRGHDQAGLYIEQNLQQSGIQCHFASRAELQTGQYTAVLDQQGELVLGLASTDIVETLSCTDIEQTLHRIGAAAMIVFDCNLSTDCIRALGSRRDTAPLAALGVSPVKSMRLLAAADAIDYLFVNRAEAAMLSGCPARQSLNDLSTALQQMQFTRHVISDGAAEVLVCDSPHSELLPVDDSVPAPSQQSVNGAGDALAGASIAALAAGLSLDQAVRDYGLKAAAGVLAGVQQ